MSFPCPAQKYRNSYYTANYIRCKATCWRPAHKIQGSVACKLQVMQLLSLRSGKLWLRTDLLKVRSVTMQWMGSRCNASTRARLVLQQGSRTYRCHSALSPLSHRLRPTSATRVDADGYGHFASACSAVNEAITASLRFVASTTHFRCNTVLRSNTVRIRVKVKDGVMFSYGCP